MRLSTRARYALRMMVALTNAEKGEKSLVSLSDISKRTNISRRYLEQLAISLKQSALVSGTAGKGGGYALLQDAGDISMANIIESAIGPINIVSCVRQPESCLHAEWCECRGIYAQINQQIVDAFQAISLAELAKLKEIPLTGPNAIEIPDELETLSGDIRGCPVSPT